MDFFLLLLRVVDEDEEGLTQMSAYKKSEGGVRGK